MLSGSLDDREAILTANQKDFDSVVVSAQDFGRRHPSLFRGGVASCYAGTNASPCQIGKSGTVQKGQTNKQDTSRRTCGVCRLLAFDRMHKQPTLAHLGGPRDRLSNTKVDLQG